MTERSARFKKQSQKLTKELAEAREAEAETRTRILRPEEPGRAGAHPARVPAERPGRRAAQPAPGALASVQEEQPRHLEGDLKGTRGRAGQGPGRASARPRTPPPAAVAAEAVAAPARSKHGAAASLIWPVNGPIVSPFGQRWARLRRRCLDIAIPAAHRSRASASRTVIFYRRLGRRRRQLHLHLARRLFLDLLRPQQLQRVTTRARASSRARSSPRPGCTGYTASARTSTSNTRIVNGSPVDPRWATSSAP